MLQTQVRPLTARSGASRPGTANSRPGTAKRELTEPPQRAPAPGAGGPAAWATAHMELRAGSQTPAWVAGPTNVHFPAEL